MPQINNIYPTYSSQTEWFEFASDRLPISTLNDLVWFTETFKNTLLNSK